MAGTSVVSVFEYDDDVLSVLTDPSAFSSEVYLPSLAGDRGFN